MDILVDGDLSDQSNIKIIESRPIGPYLYETFKQSAFGDPSSGEESEFDCVFVQYRHRGWHSRRFNIVRFCKVIRPRVCFAMF